MKLQHKIWLVTGAVFLLIMAIDAAIGFRTIALNTRAQLSREAKDIRALLMATRRVYHKQFLSSGLPLTDKTIGFLPAHALNRIAADFSNWTQSGVYFNNVSDMPRNPDNRADAAEIEAISYFRAYPKAADRIVEIVGSKGEALLHFSSPVWVESYCLNCHGERGKAPTTIANLYDTAYDYKVGDLRGVLSIKIPEAPLMNAEYQGWLNRFLVRLVGYVIVLVLLGLMMNTLISRRLARFEAVAGRIGAGDYTARVAESGNDELTSLGRSFDGMVETLQQRNMELGHFKAIVDSTEDAVISKTLSGIIKSWNHGAEKIFGYTAAEAIGQSMTLLIPADRAQEETDILARLARGERVEHYQTVRRHQDGHLIHISATISAIVDSDGKMIGVSKIARDITAIKEAEVELETYRTHLEKVVKERTAELSVAKETAEAANRAKSTFLSNMSHEIRTPMNAIIGMSTLALRHATDPTLIDQLTKVTNSSQHLLGIINDILDLSKIEAEHLDLEQLDFKLGSVLENLVSLTRQRVAEKGLALIIDVAPELANRMVRGDTLRLSQILLNLTTNAVKFTADGSVTVRTGLVEESATDILVRFEIIDTGIGVAPEDQQRLFTAFEQADGSTTRKYGGSGLGLAISKRLAEAMGGTIGVDSRAGMGSTFWFTIRFGKAVESGSASAETAKPKAETILRARYAGTRILLVEDEPINQEVSKILLEDIGLNVDIAADGVEALAMAKLTNYRLILMDMQMPRLNGLDATVAIRALPDRAQTPIVAMTANAFVEDKAKCYDAGMNDFLTKPVDPDTLFATVLKWLERPA